MTPSADLSVISVDPEIMSGAPCFRGTRVLVSTLFEYLAAGDPLEEFLEDFPTVRREQALRAIEEAAEAVLERHGTPAAW